MDLGLQGKVAIITGASKGIGLAIAERLSAEGMSVVLAARSGDALGALAKRLESAGGRAIALPRDLSLASAPAEVVEVAVARFGRLDLVVNNAGATKRGNFLELTEQDWADGFSLKFFAAVRTSRAAWPHLVAVKGSIVNISGVGGRTGTEQFTIGGSVNAAMLNLTKCLADRGVREGVRVNAVNPGSILTDRLTTRLAQLAQSRGISSKEAGEVMAQQQGIARFGEAGEIADVVAFLGSDRAAYVQGAIIDVDGGMTRTL